MTLKEELEILRGEPIQVFEGDPMGIPCIETSDKEKLCKHPVVSVNMITYNHEPYIRQAIEGVMMQKTDFEFELVIGEDCSTDKTREVCFEYQKRYPDKIRVLWCDHNLYRNPHPAGGNAERNMAHCRGDFIAICEGDDFWTDPYKLQKQVDSLKKHPNASVCFGRTKSINQKNGETKSVPPLGAQPVIISGHEFNRLRVYDDNSGALGAITENHIRTLSSMFRRSALAEVRLKFPEIFSYKLCAGDFRLWTAMALAGDMLFLPDEVGVYRIHAGGITSMAGDRVWFDCQVVRAWYLRAIDGLPIDAVVAKIPNLASMLVGRLMCKGGADQRDFAHHVLEAKLSRQLFRSGFDRLYFMLMRIGLLSGHIRGICARIGRRIN